MMDRYGSRVRLASFEKACTPGGHVPMPYEQQDASHLAFAWRINTKTGDLEI
jgi:hypothetical protein